MLLIFGLEPYFFKIKLGYLSFNTNRLEFSIFYQSLDIEVSISVIKIHDLTFACFTDLTFLVWMILLQIIKKSVRTITLFIAFRNTKFMDTMTTMVVIFCNRSFNLFSKYPLYGNLWINTIYITAIVCS